MHIEPGVVTGAKLALGSVTAAGAATVSAKMVWENLVQRGAASLIARSAMATAATFVFFELLPHLAVGPSEVHLILGSTLLLMLGTGSSYGAATPIPNPVAVTVALPGFRSMRMSDSAACSRRLCRYFRSSASSFSSCG